ncbi:MarR family transcriptional regulator [Streptomyces sp. HMX87]|uniref:MarR family transcriptional regulator n=1 Tax=Streptomyces sp. HMX87 TaxID=3390849 RepID=UPI003A8B8412
MANPGYGKRSAPAGPGAALRPADFSHLPAREAYIAAYVDRLPDGAAMDVKSLAKVLPLYGQQAVRSALNHLSRAGHLHRVRGLAATGDGGTRWVFRTFWSGTARDSAWWARFLEGGEATDVAMSVIGTDEVTTPSSDPESVPEPQSEPASAAPETHRATAYRVLARLGRVEPRLALSEADCRDLVDLVVPWLERGTDTVSLMRALTAGLPDAVHAPRGFVARRLRDKVPPVQAAPAASAPVRDSAAPRLVGRLMPECTECGVPGRPAAFVGGLCRGCRTVAAPGDVRDTVRSAPPVVPPPSVCRRPGRTRAVTRSRGEPALTPPA